MAERRTTKAERVRVGSARPRAGQPRRTPGPARATPVLRADGQADSRADRAARPGRAPVAEGPVRTARFDSERAEDDGVEVIDDQPDDAAAEEGTGPKAPLCSFALCPICMTLTALGDARPDLVEHALLASREMLLAVRALIDARLESTQAQKPRLERLRIG